MKYVLIYYFIAVLSLNISISQQTACVPNAAYCATCDVNAVNCLSCTQSGRYVPNGLGPSCSLCNVNCKTCTNVDTNCTTCTNGKWLNISTCSACSTNCKTCDTSATHCTSCNLNMYRNLDQGQICQTISQCIVIQGYYPSANFYCFACKPSCQNCATIDSNCTQCLATQVDHNLQLFLLIPDDSSQSQTCISSDDCLAISTAPHFTQGDYTTSGVCNLCDSTCASCQSVYTNCTSCSGVYFLNLNACLLSADCFAIGKSPNTQTNICQSCDPNCYTCTSVSTFCTSCNAGMVLNAIKNNICQTVAQCQVAGFYAAVHNCLACDASCLTCNDVTAANCTSCDASNDYYLTALYTCINSASCLQNTSNFLEVSSSQQGKCSPCNASCLTCEFKATQCTSCQTTYLSGNICVKKQDCIVVVGFFAQDSPNLCLPCDANCKTCQTTSTHCLSCNLVNYLEVANACVPCNSECITCAGSSSNCTSCSNSLYMNLNQQNACQTLSQCEAIIGYFADSSFFCSPCIPNCYKCQTREDTCTQCLANQTDTTQRQYLDPTLNVSNCVSEVQCTSSSRAAPYFIKNGGTDNGLCQPCNASCHTCVNQSDYCTSCNGSLFFQVPNCISKTDCEAQNGNFANKVNNVCDYCDSSCLTCTDVATHCTSCDTTSSNKYYLAANNSCLTLIQCQNKFVNGYYIDSALYNCALCQTQCLTCSSLSSCQTCSVGFYLYTDQCLTSDQCYAVSSSPSYYPVSASASCDLCTPQFCSKCSVLGVCIECKQIGDDLTGTKYYLDKGDCSTACSAIPTFQFQFFDPVTLIGACFVCDPSCATCNGTSSKSCLTCSTQVPTLYFTQSIQTCAQACGATRFPITSNQTCGDCNQTVCQNCIGNSTNCTSCNKGTYYMNSSCHLNCSEGNATIGYFYANNDTNTCDACNIKCKQCSSGVTCDSCDGISYFMDFNTTDSIKCVAQCQDQSYSDNKTASCVTTDQCGLGLYGDDSARACKACGVQNCSRCYGNGTCQQCNETKKFLAYNLTSCWNSCPDGTISQTSQNLCTSCDSSCLTCAGLLASDCLTCPSASYKDYNDPLGNRSKNDTGKCIASYNDCQSGWQVLWPAGMDNLIMVNSLQGPYHASQEVNQCVQKCENGTYIDNDNICQVCQGNCQTCIDSGTTTCNLVFAENLIQNNNTSVFYGKSNQASSIASVADPLNANKTAYTFKQVTYGGDAFSATYQSVSGTVKVCYDYLGYGPKSGGFVGISDGLPEQYVWYGGYAGFPGLTVIHQDDSQWHTYCFNARVTPNKDFRIMFEDYIGAGNSAGDFFFRNIKEIEWTQSSDIDAVETQCVTNRQEWYNSLAISQTLQGPANQGAGLSTLSILLAASTPYPNFCYEIDIRQGSKAVPFSINYQSNRNLVLQVKFSISDLSSTFSCPTIQSSSTTTYTCEIALHISDNGVAEISQSLSFKVDVNKNTTTIANLQSLTNDAIQPCSVQATCVSTVARDMTGLICQDAACASLLTTQPALKLYDTFQLIYNVEAKYLNFVKVTTQNVYYSCSDPEVEGRMANPGRWQSVELTPGKVNVQIQLMQSGQCKYQVYYQTQIVPGAYIPLEVSNRFLAQLADNLVQGNAVFEFDIKVSNNPKGKIPNPLIADNYVKTMDYRVPYNQATTLISTLCFAIFSVFIWL